MKLSEQIDRYIVEKRYRLINSVILWQGDPMAQTMSGADSVGGEVLAENYYNGCTVESRGVMRSVMKSVLSAAVGIACRQGKLTDLDTKVATYLEPFREGRDPLHRVITVRHLLTMATFNETNSYDFDTPNFVQSFFDNDYPKHMPGTVFHYDTAGTTVLCGIVEKLTGKPMLEYMRPLFDELGISKDAWCVQTPEGGSWTGSGILITSRDLARFGLFCLQRGEWNGKQLVSREYMESATSYQIDTHAADGSVGPGGYGYQFWMLREGGFACCGMGSQFAFMMPKYDTVMVINSDTQGINNADDFIKEAHYRLLHKLSDGPLPEDPEAQEALKRRSESMTLPIPMGKKTSPMAAMVSGATYTFEENNWGYKWMRVDFTDEACTLTYEKNTGVHSFPLFLGEYGALTFPEKFFGKRIGTADRNYQCVSVAVWERECTLLEIEHSIFEKVKQKMDKRL